MREVLRIKEGDSDSPEVKKAKNAVVNGRRNGSVIKWTMCGNCGRTDLAIEGHHHNGYDEENMTDVKWLCIDCHKEADNKLRADARELEMEARSLVRVTAMFDGMGTYTLSYQGGVHTFKGSVEEFAKFLRRIKASDDKEDPKTNRSLTYLNMAQEITSGVDSIIWIWSSILSQFKGIPIYMKDGKMREAKKEYEFDSANLFIKGMGMDRNGNWVVRLSYPNGSGFSIQTNGVLPTINNIRNMNDLLNSSPRELADVESEIINYIQKYGTPKQKSGLRLPKSYPTESVFVVDNDIKLPGTNILLEQGDQIKVYEKERVLENLRLARITVGMDLAMGKSFERFLKSIKVNIESINNEQDFIVKNLSPDQLDEIEKYITKHDRNKNSYVLDKSGIPENISYWSGQDFVINR